VGILEPFRYTPLLCHQGGLVTCTDIANITEIHETSRVSDVNARLENARGFYGKWVLLDREKRNGQTVYILGRVGTKPTIVAATDWE
jgi:hypothetical protein